MAAHTVLLDACVLYPAPLRDLLLHLAQMGLFQPRWTDQIHEEWIRNVLENRPDLTLERLSRTRALMDQAVLDCLVTGYEGLIPGLTLPDQEDRHILAAAIWCKADQIITFNLKDFPQDTLKPFGIEACSPDDFVARLIDLNAVLVQQAVKKQRQGLKNPPKSPEELLEVFERQGLSQTVKHLRNAIELL